MMQSKCKYKVKCFKLKERKTKRPHHNRKHYSLQRRNVVVINKHPFNSVVEELGVVTFFTWRQTHDSDMVCVVLDKIQYM